MPRAAAKSKHPPLVTIAYLLQLAGMPDCVRPGGVTDVLLVVVIGLDVVEVVEEIVVGAWTQ